MTSSEASRFTDAPNMQQYPDPNAGADGAGQPFYSPGQQQSAAPNSDELQLTAQLTREVVPMMNAGLGGNMSERQGSHGPSQGNMNHDYDHGPHPQQMSPFHNPINQLGAQYGEPDGQPPAKRRNTGKAGGDKKSSRACDECRRKKVKCDAPQPAEGESVQCSGCKRTNVMCQFERQQQKRGPSKGYIKELADRLVTLETAVHSGDVTGYTGQQESPLQRRLSDEFSPPPNAEYRKRTHSSISNDFTGFPSQAQKNWSPSAPTRQLQPNTYSPQQSRLFKEPQYPPNGLSLTQDWGAVPESHFPNPSFPASEDIHTQRVPDLDENIFEGYRQFIHPTFPILTLETHKIFAQLNGAPKTLKAAFHHALHAAVRSFPGDLHQSYDPQSTERAVRFLSSTQFESFPRTKVTDLITMQAYVLLAIAANNSPTLALRPQHILVNSILSEAITFAYSLKLHQINSPPLGDESDSGARILWRIWLSVICLDRWNAVYMDRPPFIHEHNIKLLEDDTIPRDLYELTRLSVQLSHTSRVLLLSLESPPPSFNSIETAGILLRGEAERIRESLPANFYPPTNAPVYHICYWYNRTLVELALPESTPGTMAETTLHLVTQLNFHAGVFSPLIHHCQVLAALALVELHGYEDTRDDAEKALQSLLNAPTVHSSWDGPVRELINIRLQHPNNASLASESLRRLADLATASGETGSDERKMVETGTAAGSAAANLTAGDPFKHFHNLRRLVANGLINAFDVGSESGR